VPGLGPMQIAFVNYRGFGGSSGIHIFHLANELEAAGIRCTALVPSHASSAHVFGKPAFRSRSFLAERIRANFLGDKAYCAEALIHAWTPRERVRRFTEVLSRRINAKYIVHLEDNEEWITSVALDYAKPRQKSGYPGGRRFPQHLSHPQHHRRFISNAAGITCINRRLQEFVPDGMPCLVFWPACEPRVFELSEQPNEALRKRLGYSDRDFLLVYPGNVNSANVDEVTSLYVAVERLNEAGRRVSLLRIGEDYVPFDCARRGLEKGWLSCAAVAERCIPDYLEAADALVQPGKSNSFNDYRFPSKLPMFLASARPVVLPNTNLGASLVDGENCLTLNDGDADEIARKLLVLMEDQSLGRRLGQNGRFFAREHFSWAASAAKLRGFYEHVLHR